jgi:hypothetical protein
MISSKVPLVVITGAILLLTACVRPMKLATPPLYLQDVEYIYCTAANLHDRPITVDIVVYDQLGDRRAGIGPRVLEPGGAAYQHCNTDLDIEVNPVRYCVITYEGEMGKVIGSVQVNPPEGEAVPASIIP